MSVATRLGAAFAALLSACTVDISNKTACNAVTDCVAGYTCVSHHCMPKGGAGIGGGGTSGNGGSTGTTDGGPPPPMCTASMVTACADPGTTCEETLCGGHVWRNQVLNSLLVSYRILDPDGMFSPGYRGAIRAAASAWTRASSGLVTIQECSVCTGRFISVVPSDGDGIMNPDAAEQFLPMPVSGRISPHRIAHQWGHVVGLAHTYERADRDRYVRFDPEIWCPPGGFGLPPHCAAGPAKPPGFPPVTTGTFGVFDGKSKMNGLRSEGICGAEEPDDDSGEPTIGDVSAAAELFFGLVSAWSPFRPIGRSVSPTEPLDYQLAPGVDPVGSPAVAELEYASPEIFVRGTDDRVYRTARSDLLTSDWLAWMPVPDAVDVDADPAVTFAYLANTETLFLAVRSGQDGNIHLSARREGTWGAWTSLGAPSAGAASGPTLASESPSSLAVLVRGGDGLIYWLACTDAEDDCASSSSQASAWKPLPPPPSGIFVGKPSAVWLREATGLTVAAIRDDRIALVMTRVNTGGGDWLPSTDVDLAPDDPNPSVAITMFSSPGYVEVFARNPQGLFVVDTLQVTPSPVGGVIASPPGAVAIVGSGDTFPGTLRLDVAAIIDDHGRPGVWWRYGDGNYTPPCHYKRPGTCLECGI
jgi:hypothetical protein